MAKSKPYYYSRVIKKDTYRGNLRITAQQYTNLKKIGTIVIISEREILATRWTGNWKTFKDTSTFSDQQALVYAALRWATMAEMVMDLEIFFRYNKIERLDTKNP